MKNKLRTNYLMFLLLLSISLFNSLAFAQDGILDYTFGIDGKIKTSLSASLDEAKSVAIQPDGKIIVAGYFIDNSYDNQFAIVRFRQDGSLDSTFGVNGKVTTTKFGSSGSKAYSIALQTDGKILVAGYTNIGIKYVFAIARYNNNGTLDNTFGSSGKITTSVGTNSCYAFSIALQPDGKIILAGYYNNGSNYDFALVRYNNNGILDNSFGNNGVVVTDINNKYDIAYSVAIQSDGKIVAAGYTSDDNHTSGDFILIRYNSDGTIDSTFNSDGIVLTDFKNGIDKAVQIKIQSDNKIIAVGYAYNDSTYDVALARYNSDGSLDDSFGLDGKVLTAIGNREDKAYAVALQFDGKIIVAGEYNNSPNHNYSDNDWVVLRYNINGTLDNSFGLYGKAITSFGSSEEAAYCIALQSDGKIVVAGHSGYDFALIRYLNTSSTSGVDLSLKENMSFSLEQNFPNPFNPVTTIQFSISSREYLTLKVFDLLGREIETIANDYFNPGMHLLTFNAKDLSTGIYVYSLQIGNRILQKKMILLK